MTFWGLRYSIQENPEIKYLFWSSTKSEFSKGMGYIDYTCAITVLGIQPHSHSTFGNDARVEITV